tara:strand:- start:12273 stop:13010 length:738 start_codon:yes stop_codon:yes gene_type:complete
MKRGQVTIFVIVGLILVIILGLLYYFQGDFKIDVKQQRLSSELEETRDFIYECLEETSKEAVYEVSLQGGYYNLPINSINNSVPYYHFNGNKDIPNKNVIEDSISSYVDDTIDFCINDFYVFDNISINADNIKSKVSIKESNINILLEYPITIEKNDIIVKDDQEYNVNLDIPIISMLDISTNIIFNFIEEDGDICASCIIDLALDNDISIELIQGFNEDIFILEDKNYEFDDLSYKFVFGVKYQ